MYTKRPWKRFLYLGERELSIIEVSWLGDEIWILLVVLMNLHIVSLRGEHVYGITMRRIFHRLCNFINVIVYFLGVLTEFKSSAKYFINVICVCKQKVRLSPMANSEWKLLNEGRNEDSEGRCFDYNFQNIHFVGLQPESSEEEGIL